MANNKKIIEQAEVLFGDALSTIGGDSVDKTDLSWDDTTKTWVLKLNNIKKDITTSLQVYTTTSTTTTTTTTSTPVPLRNVKINLSSSKYFDNITATAYSSENELNSNIDGEEAEEAKLNGDVFSFGVKPTKNCAKILFTPKEGKRVEIEDEKHNFT